LTGQIRRDQRSQKKVQSRERAFEYWPEDCEGQSPFGRERTPLRAKPLRSF